MALVTDRDKCAHLLRRFGLGASEAEIDFYLQDGMSGAIDRLLDDSIPDGVDLDPQQFLNNNGILPTPVVIDLWITRMIMTRRPLREKMTLFWHDHFATSASKVANTMMMLQQNELMRKNALGSFRTLLTEVSKDPAMIYWLDNQQNVKGHPNENFAREVMELFTLGIGNYTEKDVQEGARAFTGWSLRGQGQKLGKRFPAEFLFRPLVHDDGIKTFLGNSSNFNGDDVLNILCDQPRTSEYLTTKIWNWFVWPQPDAATIAPFAKRFRESGLDIKSLIKDIMKSSEFYSSRAERTVIKNPVDFCVATLRQLGVGEQVSRRLGAVAAGETVPRGVLAPAHVAQLSMKGMGMWLMYPPDVAGWNTGESWITSATVVERIEWSDKIFGQGKTAKLELRYPAYGLLKDDTTPNAVVDKLLSIFDAPIKADKRAALIAAATKVSGGQLTPENANQVAALVSRLIFATPDFQFG
ncbi:DUF1800 domain-containing protein [Fimbriimonas ginsengisoli]|uniref:Putative cytosolic protein n=1 Tax=Fimbriimonas ginsengisoli Gsoil 348 TaxID=661478 RepID=A0A068NN11_FIMGI|nr:DUF1800 domain-containing protein [Fimbriimonas ginsengisoli]AIE84948.1 putative cytosolic protein [Fimbriimonas ginsengisoli Gsoil 348]